MFKPNTERIRNLAEMFPDVIQELEKIFKGKTHIYLDFANVIHWQNRRLGWHIDLKRLKQFLNSFDSVKSVGFYFGTLKGDANSEALIQEARNLGYDVKTKPVKFIRLSIDTSSVPSNSPALLQSFIKRCLLSLLNIETIEFLNTKLADFNKQGVLYIEDRKCNFDVEIGRDMSRDFDKNNVENFVLWSGDSDFVDPISQLVEDGKNVYLFATAREISHELSEMNVPIFDIKKIREFICRPKEIPQNIKTKLEKTK